MSSSLRSRRITLGNESQLKDRVERKLDQFDSIREPHEAQVQVAIQPLTTLHEARYAVQKLKEKYGTDNDLFEMLEPISRVIGWVEATTYFLDVTTQRDAVKTLFSNVGQIPALTNDR